VTMPKTKTRIWDPAEHLITDEDMAAYLEAALQDGDSALIAAALGDIARARGMSQIARNAGLGRESLYKALSAGGNPEFATIMKVIAALGLRLHASLSTCGHLNQRLSMNNASRTSAEAFAAHWINSTTF